MWLVLLLLESLNMLFFKEWLRQDLAQKYRCGQNYWWFAHFSDKIGPPFLSNPDHICNKFLGGAACYHSLCFKITQLPKSWIDLTIAVVGQLLLRMSHHSSKKLIRCKTAQTFVVSRPPTAVLKSYFFARVSI